MRLQIAKFLALGLLFIHTSLASWSVDTDHGIGEAFAVPCNTTDVLSANHKRDTLEVEHFTDVPSNRFVSVWDEMKARGFRLISLSIYGPSNSVRFALVYRKEAWPGLRYAYNLREAAWNDWVADLRATGYTLSQVSATGEAGDVRYAGLAERGVRDHFFRCSLTGDQLRDTHNDQRRAGRIMKTVRQYGSASTRRYCVLFHANPAQEKYTFFRAMEREQYRARYAAELTKRYWHPEFLSMSEDGRYDAVFTNAHRGATHSDSLMTRQELDTLVSQLRGQGLYLHTLQARGSGSNARFAGLWSSLDGLQPRAWRWQTGADRVVSASFKTDVSALVRDFMVDNGVRFAQFAVGRQGDVLFERAFTWSESGRHSARPSDRFYLASVSKMFTGAATQALIDQGRMRGDTRVAGLLNLPEAPVDARFGNITVDHLINHRGGWDRDVPGRVEASHDMRQAALDMNGGTRPASTQDMARWIARRRLDFDPGTRRVYSNDGYMLLGRVIERVSGLEYMNYLNTAVLTPENLGVGFWATDPAAHETDIVSQEDWRTGLSTLRPTSNDEVAAVFGGAGRYFESSKSVTSLTASAATLTRFAAGHAVRGRGGRAVDCMNGSAPGSRTMVCAADNGYDWAVIFNSRDFPLDSNGDTRFDAVTAGLKSLVQGLP